MQFPRHQRLWARIETSYRTGDLAHDALHVSRVYHWCIKLAQAEGEDADVAGACGLVHDQVYVRKDSEHRSSASDRSATASMVPLQEAGYTAAEIDAIVRAVSGSSWSRQQEADTRLGAILQDADRLDALGAVGVARTFACAQTMAKEGHGLYCGDDPFDAPIKDDCRYAVDHFFVKLLRLADGMHFELSRQEGERRHRFLLQFIDAMRLDLTGIIALPTNCSAPC